MSRRADEVAVVMAAAIREIRKLSDADLSALIAGEAQLKLVPNGHRVTAPRTSSRSARVDAIDVDQVRAQLGQATTEAQAIEQLRATGLTVAGLKQLAQRLDVRPTKTTASAIIADIVKVYVSGRLTTQVVQRF